MRPRVYLNTLFVKPIKTPRTVREAYGISKIENNIRLRLCQFYIDSI